MPYRIQKNRDGDGYFVVKADSGERMSGEPYATRTKARAQLRALYANESAASKAMPFGDAGGDAGSDDAETQAQQGAMTRDQVLELLQELHDITCELGAACGTGEMGQEEDLEGEGEFSEDELAEGESEGGPLPIGAELAQGQEDEGEAESELPPTTEKLPGQEGENEQDTETQDRYNETQAEINAALPATGEKPNPKGGPTKPKAEMGTPEEQRKKKKPFPFGKSGFKGVEDLAKHLKNKLGSDPGFFTACMDDESIAGYDSDARKRLCARLHKEAVGVWPAENVEKSAASKHPGHDDQSVHDPTKGRGGGGDDAGLSRFGKVPRGGNDLRWRAEDTIAGDLVIETPSNFDTSKLMPVHAAEYIRTNAKGLVHGIRGGEDLDSIKITGLERGKGFIRVKVDITPSEDAGAAWAESSSDVRTRAMRSKALSVSYIKSLHIPHAEQLFRDVLAVKSTSADSVKGYLAIWGDPDDVDVESEFFTGKDAPIGPTDFWDDKLSMPRPLIWDHAQDGATKANPVIGSIQEFGDDDVGRWYSAQLDRAHKYRKAIDGLLSKRALGTSSDSAPQYVIREKVGKGATWLKRWPLFAAALTTTPCEPRQIGSVDYFKSLGIDLGVLPSPSTDAAQEAARAEIERRVQSAKRLERELKLYA